MVFLSTKILFLIYAVSPPVNCKSVLTQDIHACLCLAVARSLTLNNTLYCPICNNTTTFKSQDRRERICFEVFH